MICQIAPARCASSALSFALMALPVVVSSPFASATQAESGPPSVESQLSQIEDKLGNKESRYASLLKEVTRSVEDAIDDAHPQVQLVRELHDAALARSARKKNPPEIVGLIETYPWHGLLELPRGLEHGTDRPIPANVDGFIHLELPEDRLPGYPELHVNHYVWGTGEIAGWQSLQKKGKAKFEGRSPKDVIYPAESLPAHEALRVYLTGNLPATPLLAIPELQHRIHSVLADKRTEAAGKKPPMDELLALFASKWNGFEYRPAYSKDDLAFTAPLLALLADMQSLPFHFANSESMKAVGDLPFTAIQTHVEYSEIFRGVTVRTSDLVAKNEAGVAVLADFTRDVTYLGRYQAMIDVLVYALLSPEIPLPMHLEPYDYPSVHGHMPPAERKAGTSHDVPRRHALLLWAAHDKDPARVAAWLHGKVMSQERNAFPSTTSLPVAMLAASRAEEQELLRAVVQKIRAEREASNSSGTGPGPFERQFSPFETYLSLEGQPNANALAHSYHQFQGELAAQITGATLDAIHAKLR